MDDSTYVKFTVSEKLNGSASSRGQDYMGGTVFNRDRVAVWEDEKVLETDGSDGCIRV